jgi:queuine/archaeosine tRNA-ribosyltransferase
MPTRNARNGSLFIDGGRIVIKNAEYRKTAHQWMKTAGAIHAGTIQGHI